MTTATKSFWKSTHPMGDDIRIGDLRVLSIVALACGLLATVTAATMFFASGLFSFDRMNYYIIGKASGGGTFEADTQTFAAIAVTVCALSLLIGIVAVVMVQRATRGVYLVAISSMLIATLITPFFIGTGISVIVAGPDFDGTSHPWFTTPSVAGFIVTPLVAIAVGFLGSHFEKRARSEMEDRA
jgi:hypothetical protein